MSAGSCTDMTRPLCVEDRPGPFRVTLVHSRTCGTSRLNPSADIRSYTGQASPRAPLGSVTGVA